VAIETSGDPKRRDHSSRGSRGGTWRHTTSVEQGEELAGIALYPEQKLSVLGDRHNFSLDQAVGRVGSVTVSDMTFGEDVRLDCGDLRDTYHVNLPLLGVVQSQHRGKTDLANPERATIYLPDGETALPRWPGGARQLSVKMSKTAVEGSLRELLGRDALPAFGQIPLESGMDVTSGTAKGWAELAVLLGEQLSREEGLPREPLIGRPLAESLIRGFLLSAGHAYREELSTPPESSRPLTVRAAIDVMEDEPLEPITVSALAARCHTNVRSLQEGFRRHVGTTPMAYLRKVRLRHAHDELLAADPASTTVTTIAFRWGFSNLGRFAAEHLAEYSQPPAQALRTTR
jgi:AraC-like DNA-binding protein